jgi:hypothetical protein
VRGDKQSIRPERAAARISDIQYARFGNRRFAGSEVVTQGAAMKEFFCAMIGLALMSIAAPQAVGQSSEAKSEIARALSAAPISVSAGAAVDVDDAKGRMTELRHGLNGWTCVIDDPAAIKHDPIEHHPACFDKHGLEWIEAFTDGRIPNPEHVGYAYMLEGGSSWSNRDPSATKLAPGQRDYIRIPAHIMILNAKIANSSGFPSGQTNPDTHKPFVMFGGTAYAILIIPVN